MDAWKEFSPVSTWKAAVGLTLFVVGVIFLLRVSGVKKFVA